MTNHQSLVSVAAVLTTVAVAVVGFRLGRTSAAWRDLRAARRDVPVKRRVAWQHTRGVTGGLLLLIAVLAVAVNDLLY